MRKQLGLMMLLVLIVFAVGCTYQSPAARQTTQVPTAESAAPTVAVSTPTPMTGAATTVATLPTATPTNSFGELTGSPEPDATTVATDEAAATATPVPADAATLESDDTSAVVADGSTYVVRWGDTLYFIAERYGTTVESIKAVNGLTTDVIIVGQELIIPADATAPPDAIPPVTGGESTHIVQPGETLFRIALQYGTTADAIARANGIVNPWFIYVGQELIIPTGGGGDVPPSGPGGGTYVVQPGDTLYSIAVRYDTTTQALMVANNLSNPNLIYVGQTLVLP